MGEAVTTFEQAFAQACGVSYGVGVACGTDGITLGLQACGIGKGDQVLVPVNTFIATLIGVIRTGAVPVLVDCDLKTGLIDLEAAKQLITPQTQAIIPVHLYGQMVSPSALLAFAQTHNLLIFEDAAQAHLATREGYVAGTVGVAAAFSFYPSKNLGGFGDGGMVVTSDAQIAEKVRVLRNYGAPRKYEHTELGANSRLDSLQAVVLNTKLPYLRQWNQFRNLAGREYDKLLKPLEDRGIISILNVSGAGHVYHLYVIRVTDHFALNRDQLYQHLNQQGIQVGIHYPIPCHLQPAYRYLGYQPGDFPQAETLCQQILSLPIYPGIIPQQIQQVVEGMRV